MRSLPRRTPGPSARTQPPAMKGRAGRSERAAGRTYLRVEGLCRLSHEARHLQLAPANKRLRSGKGLPRPNYNLARRSVRRARLGIQGALRKRPGEGDGGAVYFRLPFIRPLVNAAAPTRSNKPMTPRPSANILPRTFPARVSFQIHGGGCRRALPPRPARTRLWL